MRNFKYPTIPDTSSNSSPGLVVAAVAALILFGAFGFHWWFTFLLIGVWALTDTIMGVEQVTEPDPGTRTVYKHRKEN